MIARLPDALIFLKILEAFFMSKKREFDYYIFIDYSENLIGYNIIEKEKVGELLLKTSRFRDRKSVV